MSASQGGTRPYKNMVQCLTESGYTVDTSRYDAGSDYISAWSKTNNINININTFNGRFTVYDPGMRKIATESSRELDGTEWYDRICSCLYYPPSRKGAV